MRALQGKIREHEIDLANNGDKFYYKKAEDKWRVPEEVIGRDGKTVVIKYGGLLR